MFYLLDSPRHPKGQNYVGLLKEVCGPYNSAQNERGNASDGAILLSIDRKFFLRLPEPWTEESYEVFSNWIKVLSPGRE